MSELTAPGPDFTEVCRLAGLKVTHQRLEIYHELAAATDHPSADTLYNRLRLRLPTISLDTVYRTLVTFAELGLANRVETVESLGRFEVAQAPHHHLICQRCGAISDVVWPELDQLPLPEHIAGWGTIDHKVLVIYGICRQCLGRE